MSKIYFGKCGLKQIEFYDKCKDCRGERGDDLCYVTKEQLRKHLQDYRKLFEEREGESDLIGRLEEIGA